MRELTFAKLLRYARILKRDGYNEGIRYFMLSAYQQGWADSGGW